MYYVHVANVGMAEWRYVLADKLLMYTDKDRILKRLIPEIRNNVGIKFTYKE